MKRAEHRIRRLERRIGTSDGIARYLNAIDGISKGPPSLQKPISPKKQVEIDEAISMLTEEEVKELMDICSPSF